MDAFRHNDVNGFVEKNAEDEAYHSGRVIQYSDSGVNHWSDELHHFSLKMRDRTTAVGFAVIQLQNVKNIS